MDIALDLPADPLQAITHADPTPYYTELARTRPFHYHAELGWWIAASAEAVDAVLGSAACAVRPASEPVPKPIADSPTGAFFGRLVRQIDGPDHDARKATVMAALGRLDAAALAARAHRQAYVSLPDAASLESALATDAHFRVPRRRWHTRCWGMTPIRRLASTTSPRISLRCRRSQGPTPSPRLTRP